MLDAAWALLAFIVAIGVLVSFHEFGHFWVARRLGVRVLRFSVGFGRPLFGWRGEDGCEYVVSAIPLGGYVKMLDEREAPVPDEELDQAFNRKPVQHRMAIVVAGPLANFLLAILFYWVMYLAGVDGLRPVVQEPPAGTLAAEAGLRAGDEVQAVNGRETPTWQALRGALIDGALDGEAMLLTVARGDGEASSMALPRPASALEPDELFAELGLRPFQPPIEPLLAEITPGSAAQAAGFRAGDRLLARDGERIDSWQGWATWVRANPGEVTRVDLMRDGQRLSLVVIVGQEPGSEPARGLFGARVEVPPDLWQDLRAEYRLGPIEAVPAAVVQTWRMSLLTLRMLHRMVVGDVSVRNVSGPIQIAQYAGYTASIGLVSFLSFMAIVSVSLGVLNLLPVPLLDGGHLLYYVVEWIRGAPLSERVQMMGQQLGLVMLVMLMGLAFYNDIMRLVG